MAGWLKMPLGMEVGLSPRDILLDEEQALPKRGYSSPLTFRPMYCGQTAGWIKMPVPLGTGVGLGPGTVLDVDPAPPKKRHSTPHFSAHVCCGQTAGDAT